MSEVKIQKNEELGIQTTMLGEEKKIRTIQQSNTLSTHSLIPRKGSLDKETVERFKEKLKKLNKSGPSEEQKKLKETIKRKVK